VPTMKPSARRTKCTIANGWKLGSENKPASSDYRDVEGLQQSGDCLRLALEAESRIVLAKTAQRLGLANGFF